MSAGCRSQMLDLVDCGAGFKQAEAFITDVCQGLVDDLDLVDIVD